MKKEKVAYYTGLIAGVIAILANHHFLGVIFMFLGVFLYVMMDKSFRTYSTTYTTKDKKPYYKNEFEEYQHYKFCKKHLRK